jgi:hypothetical protein
MKRGEGYSERGGMSHVMGGLGTSILYALHENGLVLYARTTLKWIFTFGMVRFRLTIQYALFSTSNFIVVRACSTSPLLTASIHTYVEEKVRSTTTSTLDC